MRRSQSYIVMLIDGDNRRDGDGREYVIAVFASP